VSLSPTEQREEDRDQKASLNAEKPRGALELAFFGFSTALAASLVAAFIEELFHSDGFLTLILLAPAFEESARVIAFLIHVRHGHVTGQSSRMSILAWGAGFGSLEFVPRLIDCFGIDAPLVATAAFAAALCPFAMHVSLSIIAARFVVRKMAAAAFVIGFGVHAAFNTYVLLMSAWTNAININVVVAEIALRAGVVALASWFAISKVGRPARHKLIP
jgi:hypothetical protein